MTPVYFVGTDGTHQVEKVKPSELGQRSEVLCTRCISRHLVNACTILVTYLDLEASDRVPAYVYHNNHAYTSAQAGLQQKLYNSINAVQGCFVLTHQHLLCAKVQVQVRYRHCSSVPVWNI